MGVEGYCTGPGLLVLLMKVTVPLRSLNALLLNVRVDDLYSTVTVLTLDSLNASVPRSLQPGVIVMQLPSMVAPSP